VTRAFTAACVQVEPAVLDRDATLERLERVTAEAAGQGATLVVFPEAFVSVYPSSVWAKALAGWSSAEAKAAFAAVARTALAIPGPDADRIGDAARDNGVVLAVGVTEVEPDRPGTLYNTLLLYDLDGTLALKHRKLVPTNHERLVWGPGDGNGLHSAATGVGRVGGLICWENYMPLARFALYDSGLEVYLAPTADDGEHWQSTLVHIARESRAYVISPCHFQRAAAYPVDFPLRGELDGVEIIGRGGSAILGPDGAYLAGPLYDEEGVLYAELDPNRLFEERQRFDPVGHYHRPDVLSLTVRANPPRMQRWSRSSS
jgi:nitrilase